MSAEWDKVEEAARALREATIRCNEAVARRKAAEHEETLAKDAYSEAGWAYRAAANNFAPGQGGQQS